MCHETLAMSAAPLEKSPVILSKFMLKNRFLVGAVWNNWAVSKLFDSKILMVSKTFVYDRQSSVTVNFEEWSGAPEFRYFTESYCGHLINVSAGSLWQDFTDLGVVTDFEWRCKGMYPSGKGEGRRIRNDYSTPPKQNPRAQSRTIAAKSNNLKMYGFWMKWKQNLCIGLFVQSSHSLRSSKNKCLEKVFKTALFLWSDLRITSVGVANQSLSE